MFGFKVLITLALASSALAVKCNIDPSGNAACGAASGYGCGLNFCCSEFGFCGDTPAHCAANCQPAYGLCTSNGSATCSGTTCSSTGTATCDAVVSKRATLNANKKRHADQQRLEKAIY